MDKPPLEFHVPTGKAHHQVRRIPYENDCEHKIYVLDDLTCTIECDVCGQRWEPYQFLKAWTSDEVAMGMHLEQTHKKLMDLHERIDMEKKELAKIKKEIRKYKEPPETDKDQLSLFQA